MNKKTEESLKAKIADLENQNIALRCENSALRVESQILADALADTNHMCMNLRRLATQRGVELQALAAK